MQITKAWERTVDEANTPQTRKIKLRSAIIVSPDKGGVFAALLNLVHFALPYGDFMPALRQARGTLFGLPFTKMPTIQAKLGACTNVFPPVLQPMDSSL